jgi:hypothetical protein
MSSPVDSIVGADVCSAWYFIFLAMMFVFLFIMTVVTILLVKREYHIKEQHGYQFVEGDLHWKSKLRVLVIWFRVFNLGFLIIRKYLDIKSTYQ